MTTDPIEPLHKLKERVAEVLEPLGLTMRMFTLVVGSGPEGDPDHVQMVFTIDTDVIGQDAEQREIDRQFEALIAGDKLAEKDQAAIDARANLEEMAKRFGGGGGFLGGPDPTPA